MGVRDGALHLEEQLKSIADQTHKNWNLIASDDGSTDQSRDILHRFSHSFPDRVSIQSGPERGFSANYMSLIATLKPDAGHVCFADQDDVWLPRKLTNSVKALSSHVAPALSCGRHYVWHSGNDRKFASAKMSRPFTFRNALIENVAAGNTMMINPPAARLAQAAALRSGPVFAHDWWLYLLMTGVSGAILFDNSTPDILYRQHARNQIGAGVGMVQQIRRKLGVLRGLFTERLDGNIAALTLVSDLLTPDARQILEQFEQARTQEGLARLLALRSVAPYRQSKMHTLGFWGAAGLGCA
ncbi:Glycosyl transferase, group 2 family protein [Sulfitobacter noctilucicola]|nr:Glycosyl transferase, group 2 family protein [Sulfitobacter noctilucicola]